MMGAVDDLVAFVRARLAEMETREAPHDGSNEGCPAGLTYGPDECDCGAGAINDERRAVAIALTALVDLHKPEWFAGGPPHGFGDDVCVLCGTVTTTGDLDGEWPCESLKLVAAIWRDHADYRTEWAA